MTALQRLDAALAIDCGVGRATGPGSFTYSKQPRAEYACLRCRTTEGPVTGAEAVKQFVANIRARHAAVCAARQAERKAA